MIKNFLLDYAVTLIFLAVIVLAILAADDVLHHVHVWGR